MANSVSEQTKAEALKIAKGIQKPGQTKEQTKVISQGIEKGITLYKQQQKAKAREADKQRKLELKAKQKADDDKLLDVKQSAADDRQGNAFKRYLPWILLVISWAGFIAYQVLIDASLTSL